MKDRRSLTKNSVRSEEIVSWLNDENLKHHHGVEWRAPALCAVRIGERSRQFRSEHLEVHHGPKRLKLIAEIPQTLHPVIDIKKPGRIESSPIRRPDGIRNAQTWPGFWNRPVCASAILAVRA